MTPWNYCPECGSRTKRTLLDCNQENHYQCEQCYQEWFSDIDYSDSVRVILMTYRESSINLRTELAATQEKLKLADGIITIAKTLRAGMTYDEFLKTLPKLQKAIKEYRGSREREGET